ncbi:MAG: hypothetical protein J5993_01650 [Clostridia bacterium]|nr:hypothetical protein [Clostridia bacterium]
MNQRNREKLVSFVKEYYAGENDPMRAFASTLRGEEKRLFEEMLCGRESEETDAMLLHCLNVMSVRTKRKNSPYGFYHR